MRSSPAMSRLNGCVRRDLRRGDRSPTTAPRAVAHATAALNFTLCLPTDTSRGRGNMGFLLAKMLFLLVLAAACGALFTYWWFRRHYEDVTLEYGRSRDEWASWRRGFEARLAARPDVDLQPLREQLAAMDELVRSIDVPIPERIDLTPLQSRLDDIERRIGDIRLPGPFDLTPMQERLTAIEHALFSVQITLAEIQCG